MEFSIPHPSEPLSTTTEDPCHKGKFQASHFPASLFLLQVSPQHFPVFSIPTYQPSHPAMSQTRLHSASLTSILLPLTAELVPNVLDPFWDADFVLLKHRAQNPSKTGLTCLVSHKFRYLLFISIVSSKSVLILTLLCITSMIIYS